MRKGWNPQKDAKLIDLKIRHKIIIVVFIPESDEYYSKVFDVFKTCLNSLQSTINNHAQIMVVNNGSSKKVFDFINSQLEKKLIDSAIHHKENIGKMDALIGAARSAREELITITDTDILFTTGWQEAVEGIFDNFPKAGSVSPIPVQANSLFYNTSSVLKDVVLKKIKYELKQIPENFEPHNKYLESINWGIKKSDTILWPVVTSRGTKAIVGSGHQVMTLRKEIFLKYVPTSPSRSLVGGNSEYVYGDEPTDKAGYYRLSTYHNYAFHMGNTLEPWMTSILSKNHKARSKSENNFNTQMNYNKSEFLDFSYKIKKRVFKKLFKFFYNHKLD
jgi:hypothetical protein